MTEDLSGLGIRELKRLAYARADSEADRERSVAASQELARRDIAAKLASPFSVERDHTSGDPVTDPAAFVGFANDRPRRRKYTLLVSIAGAVAVLFMAAIIASVSSTSAEDPLAIFDEPVTQVDTEWATRLEMPGERTITVGPRVIDLGEDLYGIAYKALAPTSNVGPQPDLYCLTLAEMPENSAGWGASHSCVTPTEFERTGVSVDIIPLTAGGATTGSLDWGPTGSPSVNPAATADGD